MGSLFNKNFKVQVEHILTEEEENIIKFFNNKIEPKHSKKERCFPNNMTDLNEDVPLVKQIYSDNIYIEVFNIPALFRLDDGVATIINKLSIIIQRFKDLHNKEEDF